MNSARAFAPGGIGNIGPGLDILGCAVTGAGDSVRASFDGHRGVVVSSSGHPDLSPDPATHASAIAAAEVIRRARFAGISNISEDVGIVLDVEKGLPLSGGQGGSAASALAGAVATNALFGDPLPREELLMAALVSEERVAGRHIDNLAPQLFGGVLLIRSIEPLSIVSLPVPETLRVVLVHPEMQLRTADARAVLPASVDRATALAQATAVAAMVAAFYSGRVADLRGTVDDRIAEPARAPLLPGFVEAKRAALDAGALGCSISGGGPSAFAFADGDHSARAVCDAMIRAYTRAGMPATGRVAEIDAQGTRIVETT